MSRDVISHDRSIDVDGCRLALRESGTSGPAVVMVSSAGGGHLQWEQLRERLGDTRCVSYGRPGIDGSDALPPDRHAVVRPTSWAADQLATLLHAARVPPPYVLASCSIGGYIAERFAARSPGDVAGLVQIDPTYITPIPGLPNDRGTIDDADGTGITFSWAMSRAELEAAPPPPPRRAVVISRAFGSVPSAVVERYWQPLTTAEADHGWRECQVRWVRRLDAHHVAADTAGHHVQVDQPELVAFVVRAMIAAVRDRDDLVLEPDAVAAAGGALLTASRHRP